MEDGPRSFFFFFFFFFGEIGLAAVISAYTVDWALKDNHLFVDFLSDLPGPAWNTKVL